MKKLLLTLLFVTFVGVLIACGGDTDNRDNGGNTWQPLFTNHTDDLRLEQEYEGYSFLEDGIGEVELAECNTGHSTDFREVGGTEVFRTRYLGIATPAPYTDPPRQWSLEVTQLVCTLLTRADTIVLQADPEAARRDNTSIGRYLVYVWYSDEDGVLRNLNLELIELAYTAYTGGASLYDDIFRTAWFETQATGRRIWGEEDPDHRTG